VLSICGNSFNTAGKVFQVKLIERMPRVCKAVIKAKGGYLKNLKYRIYTQNILLGLLHDSMCYFIVENSKNKEKPLNE
jgi:hypothetical protein